MESSIITTAKAYHIDHYAISFVKISPLVQGLHDLKYKIKRTSVC